MTTTEQPTDRYAAKVAKLLETAELNRRNGHDAEADLALERAGALMLRYEIDRAAVAALASLTSSTPIEIVEKIVRFEGIFADIQMRGFNSVVKAFGLASSFYTKHDKRDLRLHLVGDRVHVETLEFLAASLAVQGASALGNWWKVNSVRYLYTTSMQRFKERRTFQQGFYQGVATRLADERAAQVNASEPGTAPVLVSAKRQADEYVAARHELRTVVSRVQHGSDDSLRSGHEAGQAANVGTTGVSGESVHRIGS